MNYDLISRKSVLDAFDCSIGGVPFDSVQYVLEYADKMMSKISALPSAPPEKKLLFSDRLQIIELYKEWILRNGARDCAESFLAYLIIEGYIDG